MQGQGDLGLYPSQLFYPYNLVLRSEADGRVHGFSVEGLEFIPHTPKKDHVLDLIIMTGGNVS
jgi:hypothetical protein